MEMKDFFTSKKNLSNAELMKAHKNSLKGSRDWLQLFFNTRPVRNQYKRGISRKERSHFSLRPITRSFFWLHKSKWLFPPETAEINF